LSSSFQPPRSERRRNTVKTAHLSNQTADEVSVAGIGKDVNELLFAGGEVIQAFDRELPREISWIAVSLQYLCLVNDDGECCIHTLLALELHCQPEYFESFGLANAQFLEDSFPLDQMICL